MERKDRQIRCRSGSFQTREENNDIFIEGYFAVFDTEYKLWEGATEAIEQGAFSGCLSSDIRALINHDTTLVLGRNKAGTLELKEDSRGLWGTVKINQSDSDAMNAYARVKRGDVSQCSIGFDIGEESFIENPDGSVRWTIKKIEPLYEVSVVTFPAYEETGVSARQKDFAQIQQRKNDEWKEKMKARIKK